VEAESGAGQQHHIYSATLKPTSPPLGGAAGRLTAAGRGCSPPHRFREGLQPTRQFEGMRNI